MTDVNDHLRDLTDGDTRMEDVAPAIEERRFLVASTLKRNMRNQCEEAFAKTDEYIAKLEYLYGDGYINAFGTTNHDGMTILLIILAIILFLAALFQAFAVKYVVV